MKTPTLILLTALLSTAALANERDRTADTDGGSAMQEQHLDQHTSGHDGETDRKRKMEVEVQEDWREDAKERRDADLMKPEQRGGS